MTTLETVKAWKDEDYRDTLTIEQQAELPEHPAGAIELQFSEFGDKGIVFGGSRKCRTFSDNCSDTKGEGCTG